MLPQAAGEDEDEVLLVDEEEGADAEEPDEPDELEEPEALDEPEEPESEPLEELALFEPALDDDFERLSVR